MQKSQFSMNEMTFAGWNVRVLEGSGTVCDACGDVVAKFFVCDEGQVTLTEGECKFADMAVIAVRSFARYGTPQTV